MCGKCLDKMERALNLWVKDTNRKRVPIGGNVLCQKALSLCEDFSSKSPEMSDHVHITFIVVYCYNYYILLLFIIYHCLIYKLNFTMGIYV